jgi:toxin secretion/phage lysis holin
MERQGAMERVWMGLQFIAAAVVAWWMGLHGVYKLLLLLQLLDVASGVIAAWRGGRLSSSVGKAGLLRKTQVWLVLLGLALIQGELGNVIEAPQLIRGYGPAELGAAAFAFMEWVSIVENAQRMGVPLPSWLQRGLAQAQRTLGYGDETPHPEGSRLGARHGKQPT